MKWKKRIPFNRPSHQYQVILSFNPIVGCILLFLEPKNAKSIYFRFICGQWKLFKMLVHPDSLNKPSRTSYKFNLNLGTIVLRMNAATCSWIVCFYVVFIVLSLYFWCFVCAKIIIHFNASFGQLICFYQNIALIQFELLWHFDYFFFLAKYANENSPIDGKSLSLLISAIPQKSNKKWKIW